ncbi:hypothetical protein [Dyadobacter sp. CY356]|uniref:hypothetical protein n=1 Tax=Dyadobacter sp. CY356 TaxID=2906442 RepID=UPI001F2B91F9|nr:hypothetical protein [Dyadobacter sp. CY356]MCF0055142.1 hypothetical protein [Dyadobacter sp. CY356]
MVKYNSVLSQLEIYIPNKDFKDLARYRKGILRILAEIPIQDCRQDFKNDLKSVYEILDYLSIESETESEPAADQKRA